ncbi:Radical SAM domain protein [Clostridium sp. DL-VIII]|uniref:B12-binding domain-containing radical SAM protein n=1 Tax=Clostridium sp. DL-VIII TaxID=641107 RepID=UPI00023B02EC|nr:radical SAM protein [Clostridium sp. DL-VIII]EHJ01786.1 Radical SAM domain protein [Clostridium sp. DL-VIII]
MNILLTFVPAMVAKKKFELWEAPPMALYVLETVLRHAGNNVKIVDPSEYLELNGEEELPQKSFELLSEKLEGIDLVAFSVNTFNWGISKIIINNLSKEFPNLLIALGGLHPTIFDEYALNTTGAHFVMRGEGEKTFPELVSCLEKGESLDYIENLSYKKNGRIKINKSAKSLPVEFLETCEQPDYSLMYQKGVYKVYPVESSRGCAFSCVFCSIPHRNNWRGYSPENVVDRVDNLVENIINLEDIDHVLFVDDCFSIDTKRAAKIFHRLFEKYGTKIKYFIEVRVSNIIKGDLFYNIPKDMISGMQIGVECGYDEGLKLVGKGITVAQLCKSLEIMHITSFANKIFLSFIIGFPWEDEADINKTLDTVQYIAQRYKVVCNLNWLLMLPSDLWSQREKYNIDVDETIYDDPLWVSSKEIFYKVHPKISKDEVKRVEERIIKLTKLSHSLVLFKKLELE